MMKILLTGKNGQVGFELQRALAPLGEVVAVDLQECDLSDAAAIRKLVAEVSPQIIVNPAAYTAVDKAEAEPQLAQAINGMAPGVFGEAAARLGALVIHYSTDYVFDGTKPTAYVEDDPIEPLGVTVMPEWFQYEGVDAVLDRLQRIGATSLANSIVASSMAERPPTRSVHAGST